MNKIKVTVPSNVDESNTKLMLVDKEVIKSIDKNPAYVADYLYEVIERLSNDIESDQSLGATVNDLNGKSLFFEFSFEVLNNWEVYLQSVKGVSSDRYLDLMLEGRLVKANSHKVRQIFQ